MKKQFARIVSVALTAACITPLWGGRSVFGAGGIPIDASHFPDANFRAIIAGPTYDTDQDGYLSDTERSQTGNIKCENSQITSIEGIEYFPEVKGLWCQNNAITEMDLSGNTHLKGIWCSNNAFSTLDFSPCTELEWVYCFECPNLYSIDTSGCPDLAFLEANSNPNLTSVDFSDNPKLEHIWVSGDNLTSIDVSDCPLLCELSAFNNNLTSLDVSSNYNLKRLDIAYNNNLGNVDVSHLYDLEYYNCAQTGCTSVDMRSNTELMYLVCSYNGTTLKTINVTNNPRLAELHVECDYNLQALDISNCPKLYYLQVFGMGNLNTLNISNNPALINAYNNGTVKDERNNLGGPIHSYMIDYGGSRDPFDFMIHGICKDDDMTLITTGGNIVIPPDCYIDTNDGHSNSETFATRGEAIQLLYELCNSPAVSGTSRFTDIPAGSTYANAVKWGQDNNICFGYPNIYSNQFCPDELISRQDFALMAHRVATYMDLGTAFDYGRTDWYSDFFDIDFYAWGPFTWACQWGVVPIQQGSAYCYPHGRMTTAELTAGANQIFDLDPNASYSQRVNPPKPDVNPSGPDNNHVNEWVQSNGNWYYYGANGQPVTDWHYIGGEFYYFDVNTAILKTNSWIAYNGYFYYVDGQGKRVKDSWVSYNGEYYYVDGMGRMLCNTWGFINNKYYYFDGLGKMKTGWLRYNGSYYYLGDDGAMKTGWIRYNNNWYYLGGDGAAKTGWVNYQGTYYYMDQTTSAMKANCWVLDNGSYYYFDAQGKMLKNTWRNINGRYYYFDGLGKMKTGWLSYQGSWYYLGSDGAMKTGWQNIGGVYYYFNNSGIMLKNSWVSGANGSFFYVDGSGAMKTNSWISYNGNWYYVNGSGYMLKSCTTPIGDGVYTFNGMGVCTNP